MTSTISTTEYYCPTSESYTSCPGPCPDGKDHGPARTRELPGYLISLDEAIARGVVPADTEISPDTLILSSRP